MRKHELEHIIRAASEITNEYEIVVVGSQSILGAVPNPPAECTVSPEADVFPLHAEHLSDVIDGAIGEGSHFHETFGYYAQGVDSTTAVLPIGWKERLVRLQSRNTHGKLGYCLDPVDLFLSKCVANREKDRLFNRALLANGIVSVPAALDRVPLLPIEPTRQKAIAALIRRLADEAQSGQP